MPNDDEYTAALARFTSTLCLLQQTATKAARRQHLHRSHYFILIILFGWPAGDVQPTIRDISDRLGFVHHATIELLATLAERNLVQRTKTASHVYLALTPAGRALAQSMVFEAKDRLLADIGAIHTATHQLMRAIDLLPEPDEDDDPVAMLAV